MKENFSTEDLQEKALAKIKVIYEQYNVSPHYKCHLELDDGKFYISSNKGDVQVEITVWVNSPYDEEPQEGYSLDLQTGCDGVKYTPHAVVLVTLEATVPLLIGLVNTLFDYAQTL